jgi:hypothetical protein
MHRHGAGGIVKFTLSALFVLTLTAALLIASKPANAGSPAGHGFQVVPTPNLNFNSGLQAASASSPNDIWAVGQSTIHYDGTKWTAFPAPKIRGDNTSFLGGVVAISPTEAWAVGSIGNGLGNPNQVIEKWDGTKWSVFPGPKFSKNQQPSLKTMASISANDIWAIGDLNDNNIGQLYFLFEHWDGTKWTASASISGDAFLFGSHADATDDVWAVGFSGPENDSSRTLAMRFDGSSWKAVSTPSVGSGANQLNGVLALAPNDVWAVGFSTPVRPPAQAATLTLIEHFDGSKWTVVPSPNVGPKTKYQSNRLFGLTANSPTDIWAFGSYFSADGFGHQKTLLLHWNGTEWIIAPSPNPTTGGYLSDLLFAGVVPEPNSVWIFGAEDEAPHEGTLAIHATTEF